MKIEIGKKTQTIMVFLLFIGIASAVSEYGNNVIISGYFSGDGGNITGLNASNIATGTAPSSIYGTGISVANISDYSSSGNVTYPVNISNGTGFASYTGLFPREMQFYTPELSEGFNVLFSFYGGVQFLRVSPVSGQVEIYEPQSASFQNVITTITDQIGGGGGANGSYSYYVYKDGTNYYARNVTTGINDFSNASDVGIVITNAVNQLATNTVPGGKIYIKKDVYYASSPIIMKNATIIEGEFHGTNADGNYNSIRSGAVIVKSATFSPMDTLIVYPNTISDHTEIRYLHLNIPSGVTGGLINLGTNTKFALIEDNVITGQVDSSFGVRIESDSGTDSSFGNVISRNKFQFIGGDSISINDTDNFVRDNTIIATGAAARGIYIGSGGSSLELSGNFIMSDLTSILLVVADGAKYNRITNNYFDSGLVDAVIDGNNHLITDNFFHRAVNQNIVYRTSNSTLANNIIFYPNATGAADFANNGHYALFIDQTEIGNSISGNQFVGYGSNLQGAIYEGQTGSRNAIYGNSIGTFASPNVLNGISSFKLNLAGTGNAYACIDASGTLYRSATACA